MSETLLIKDFSAGWCPSDDPVNGRPNAQLMMDNLELTKNGALTLAGGTSVVYSGYTAPAHTLYSRYINGVRCDYAACLNGYTYRNRAIIDVYGDPTNAAFSTAFNFTLVANGPQRIKDNGTTVVGLGIVPPTAPSNINVDGCLTSFLPLGSYWVVPAGLGSATGSGIILNLTTNSTGLGVVQSYGIPSIPFDFTKLTGTYVSGTQMDSDIMSMQLYNFYTTTDGFQIDILLSTPDSTGDQVSDYYTYNTGNGQGIISGDTASGQILLQIHRSDFTRVGLNSALGWNTVYGYRISFASSRPLPTLNVLTLSTGLRFMGGTATPLGIYDYALMGINNTGSYVGKSVLSPILASINTQDTYLITELNWTAPTDQQITDVWIFRRNAASGGSNGTLGQWYQVGSVPVNNTYFWDTTVDQVALTTDITVNLNLISVAHVSYGITDKIFDILGPINGRWYYFTTNFMYPSDLNNPDLVDASLAVRTCGSASELFMWARQISSSVVLVGTSCNVYLLTGTFTTFPDNSIDVYYQPEGVTQFPPITNDAIAYQGAVYYIANDGWRICTATSFGTTYSSANNQLLIAPNLDVLYNNTSVYSYPAINLQIAPGTARYPVTVVRNKLWCFIGSYIHVYDFVRQYWRVVNYGLGSVTACTSTQDGQILAFYSNGELLRAVGVNTTKLIDGVTKQTVQLLLPYKDNGQPRQRKDTYTFKSKCVVSNGDILNVFVTDENGALYILPNLVGTTSVNAEQVLDMSQVFHESTTFPTAPKLYQIFIRGNVADLTIENLSIDYDARPVPLSFVRLFPNNFKQPVPKRIRTWPLTLDTRGNPITFTPTVDSVAYPQYAATFTTTDKQTVYYFYDWDVFGIDYGGLLYDPLGTMEFWEVGNPDIVQALPIPRQFDQIGPQEFARLGKIVQIGLRVLSYGTSIPYIIYFSDNNVWTGTFTTILGIEDTYYADVPKGVNGRILRVVLGPTSFNFHRYYMKFKCAESGGQEDTELRWVTIPGQMGMM